ncbi:LamG domain-containing protein [Streptomyces sp. NPDC006475]|uniref:LamG domain-containing protein n=1 Tax=Streptomyces sp. NPDC006475 TaxID=3155719 RepID=UPI0033AF9549
MANPDGTFTLTQSTTPQRVKDEDGSWRSVDVTLERREDGTVGPKAAVVDLSFAGGGSGKDLIRLATSAGAVELGWPRALPTPLLDGATATYPEVLAGVDLQLTATATGYREVLVVKSAEAAGSAELEQVKLTAAGEGLQILPGPGGGLRAVDGNGNNVLTGPAGMMWDSTGDTADPGPQPQMLRSTSPDEPVAPVDGDPQAARPDRDDASAELPVVVENNAIAVEPDLTLLRGKDTVYPVYIDPSIGLGVSERTVLSSDGDHFWDFDGDYGVGNCSHVGPWYCGGDWTNRMYFEFAPTKLSGRYVIDATFRAYETWSFSCTPHEVDLWRTNNISSATRWPGPAQVDLMGDRNVSAGRGENCSPSQPDSWVEFNDSASETDENLTKTVRSFADGNFSRLTLMLRAKNENDPDAWKRFDDNAELQVVYAMKASVPTDKGVIPGDGNMQGCSTDAAKPVIATRPDPMIQGRLQTQIESGLQEERGSLRAFFLAEKKQNDGSWAVAWTAADPVTGYQVDDYLAKRRMNAGAHGSLYRVKSLTQSFFTYEGNTTAISSGYGGWCYFKIDLDAPKEPVIEPGTPYNATCADEGCGEPGVAGSFTFKPNPEDANDTTDPDIIGYRWSLSTKAGATEVISSDATGDVVTINNVTPSVAGTTVLTVEARDVRERYGPASTFTFKVSQPDGAVGRWHFNDGTDSATDGTTRHPMTLHQQAGKAATFGGEGRRGDGDHSLRLNDDVSDSAQQIGYASTQGGPPVDTSRSFTISAWAMLGDDSKTRIVASAPGTYASAAFNLFYSKSANRWAFNRAVSNSGTPDYVSALSDTAPPTGVWTHLTGVFDTKGDQNKANDTIQLFVNGRPQGPDKAVVLYTENAAYTPWASTQDLRVGASKAGEYFMGRIDELAVWQRAQTRPLVADDAKLTENDDQATALVASWDATGATGNAVADTSQYKRPDLALKGGATLDGEQGIVLNGTTGYAAMTGPVVDETGSFTVSARVSLREVDLESKPVGYRAQVAGQRTGAESSWALWVVKRDVGAYQWKFTRTGVDDTTGQVVRSAEIAQLDGLADTSGSSVDVTGVFDAQARRTEGSTETYGELRLFIGEQSMNDSAGTNSFTAAEQGVADLTVGRGTTSGTTAHYLPGAVQKLRVWSGAMSEAQVSAQIPDSAAWR